MSWRTSSVLVLLLLACVPLVYSPKIPDPKRFESEIAAFEKEDRAAPPPAGAIVLTGSSSITKWNSEAKSALAPLTVIPRGFGGSVMRDLAYYLDRVVLVYKPRAILIYEGDNDTGGYPRVLDVEILADLQRIIARIHQSLPEARIYLLSIKPSVSRSKRWRFAEKINAEYRRIAEGDPLVHYVDMVTPMLNADGSIREELFQEDKLHLNAAGNVVWGAAIRAALMPGEAAAE